MTDHSDVIVTTADTVNVRLDDRIRLISSALAATDFPEKSQCLKLSGVKRDDAGPARAVPLRPASRRAIGQMSVKAGVVNDIMRSYSRRRTRGRTMTTPVNIELDDELVSLCREAYVVEIFGAD
jgi:hypothetical protein